MRKVVAAEYVSVDGVLQDPGGVWGNRARRMDKPVLQQRARKNQSDQLFHGDNLARRGEGGKETRKATVDRSPAAVQKNQW